MEREIIGRRIGATLKRMDARGRVLVLISLLGVVAALLAPARVDAAPILEVSGGILTGARDVEVQGALYDVTFVTGTCIDVFDGCDSSTDFAFSDQRTDGGRIAAEALMAQVLVDTPLGQFDTQPDLVYGCPAGKDCWFYIPNWQPDSADEVVMGTVAINAAPTDHPDVVTGIFVQHRQDIRLWAKFTPSPPSVSEVPEPGSLLLLGSGLVAAVSARRRRRK